MAFANLRCAVSGPRSARPRQRAGPAGVALPTVLAHPGARACRGPASRPPARCPLHLQPDREPGAAAVGHHRLERRRTLACPCVTGRSGGQHRGMTCPGTRAPGPEPRWSRQLLRSAPAGAVFSMRSTDSGHVHLVVAQPRVGVGARLVAVPAVLGAIAVVDFAVVGTGSWWTPGTPPRGRRRCSGSSCPCRRRRCGACPRSFLPRPLVSQSRFRMCIRS